MPKHCDQCGQDFSPEPGFYIGAMYVSYGLCVGMFLFLFFLAEVFYEVSGVVFIAGYTLLLIVLFPYIFRYSRVAYIHLFYEYKADAKAKFQAEKHLKAGKE